MAAIGSFILYLLAAVVFSPRADSSTLSGLDGLSKLTTKSGLPLQCGYQSCPKTRTNGINVHIVAHTHDDVGWLKSVDQYFYGTDKRDSQASVQSILDTVIPQLIMDETKRFIYVEMSFFTKWWKEQNEPMKKVVRQLVNEGRLEFINGGWCMNDEATVSYQSVIEQMTLGLKFLNDTFGSCGHPKVGWQIDPFGHTNEQASLFAQFGFDGMYFTRISYDDKEQRADSKSLEMMWDGDEALQGDKGTIFTSIFRDGYDAPNGFCFDALCQDDILVDNKESFEYNVDGKGNDFIDFIRDYATSRLTNHLLIPMGGDFQYSAANQNFKSLDKLIKYVRAKAPDINIFYSTPSCYQYSVNQIFQNSSLKLPDKFDDFMPYKTSDTVWWSGYFSSRPSVKLVERQVANLLPVVRFVSLARLLRRNRREQSNWTQLLGQHEAMCLTPLWEILGDLQHHDAITGTEKQHVANDYVRRASDAQSKCGKFIGDMRRSRLEENLQSSARMEQLRETGKKFKLDSVYLEDTTLCPLLNISQCDPIEAEVRLSNFRSNLKDDVYKRIRSFGPIPPELSTKSVLLNVYNPLAKPIAQHSVRIPCISRCDLTKIKVTHLSTGEELSLIRLPVPPGVAKLPFRTATTSYEIVFYVNLPPLGFISLIVEDHNEEDIFDEEQEDGDSIVISEDSLSNKAKNTIRSRRITRNAPKYEYFDMNLGETSESRTKRDVNNSQQDHIDRVIVKFDVNSGVIVGLQRVRDGNKVNITQKFGYYYPASDGAPPGAYTFRPNSDEPHLLDKPMSYKMFKRKNGGIIEIQQKWTDWIWQTIRVDSKKNYIEYDHVIGPIPASNADGREVITRYITSIKNDGVFLTDSNNRQLMGRRKNYNGEPTDLGGSFHPVVSTMVLRDLSQSGNNSVQAVAILVDRPQAGTSLNEGQMEFLIHRRLFYDDNWGVGEPLNEPGEDGRGLVSRGKHRLYLKFPGDQPETDGSKPKMFKLTKNNNANLDFEKLKLSKNPSNKKIQLDSVGDNYLVYDRIYNELKQEATEMAMSPVLTFDRLRVDSKVFIEMVNGDGPKAKLDFSLLNMSLPNNINLLTLQPWNNEDDTILIRLENLDNPLLITAFPHPSSYMQLRNYYSQQSDIKKVSESTDNCDDIAGAPVEVDLKNLIKKIQIVSLQELTLGANKPYNPNDRLVWNQKKNQMTKACQRGTSSPTSVKLNPREIGTYLAKFIYL